MKIWYYAVCDEHKEMIDIFVHNLAPDASAGVFIHEYLKDEEKDIITWLRLHVECCVVRLISEDKQLDECFEKGYERVI